MVVSRKKKSPKPDNPLPAGPSSGTLGKWESEIRSAAAEFGVDPIRLYAHMMIESEGKPGAIQENPLGWSYGLMQVVPRWWKDDIGRLAGKTFASNHQAGEAMLDDPLLALRAGAFVLKAYYARCETWDGASSAFFTNTCDWNGDGDVVNGTKPKEYRDRLNAIIAEKSTTPAPEPEPRGDVLDLLFGGKPYTITAGYGQLVTWSCPGCYDYFAAYGLDTRHHWAYDVSAAAGDGAPLYAPFDGTVVCAGTDRGPGAWGTGCASFPHVNNYGGKPSRYGGGRLEILNEAGAASLIIGHVLSSRVNPGDRVKTGDRIGEQGGMNGSHVHAEGRTANGRRIGDPRVLFPGNGTTPTAYVERLDVPQPAEFEDGQAWEVKVTAASVPVLQYADIMAPAVAAPLVMGETFSAPYLVHGRDGRAYWVSRARGRVPKAGTKELSGTIT